MKTILYTIILSLFVVPCFADALLTWDPNSESDLDGYKVYYGEAPRLYTISEDVGNVTQNIVTVDKDLMYIAVTAYDTVQNESGYSNEVRYIQGPNGITNLRP